MPDRIVVCVDDEPIILLALKHKLRSAMGGDFRCETAVSAESALELIAELASEGAEVVAVVSDWLMPGMRGDEFLRQARAMLPAACLILLTGYAERVMIQALEREIDLAATFQKPCDTKALLGLIAGRASES